MVYWRGGSAISFGEVALPFNELRSVLRGSRDSLHYSKGKYSAASGNRNFWAVTKVIYDVLRGERTCSEKMSTLWRKVCTLEKRMGSDTLALFK